MKFFRIVCRIALLLMFAAAFLLLLDASINADAKFDVVIFAFFAGAAFTLFFDLL